MTPTRWQEIERVYHAALERPLTERAAFLAESCAGDAELRREVESLLDQCGADAAQSLPYGSSPWRPCHQPNPAKILAWTGAFLPRGSCGYRRGSA